MSSKKRKAKNPDALVIVAHADDEALFFSGLMLAKKMKWHLVCVTDGNADGQGWLRAKQFEEACRLLKVNLGEIWNFPDVFAERLDIEALQTKLSELGKYKAVYTHGPLGEYGHAHHQDVSYAVHRAFAGRAPVYSPAYNIFADLKISLSPSQFRLKTKLLWDIYGSEIRRFIHFLPATSVENFARISPKEVGALYDWVARGESLRKNEIKKYNWLIPWLEQGGGRLKDRPF